MAMDINLTVRMTDEDRNIIEAMAKVRCAQGCFKEPSISEYIRWLINRDAVVFKEDYEKRRKG